MNWPWSDMKSKIMFEVFTWLYAVECDGRDERHSISEDIYVIHLRYADQRWAQKCWKIKLGFPTRALQIILKIYSLKWIVFFLCFVSTDHLKSFNTQVNFTSMEPREPNGSNAYPKYYYNIAISSVLLYSHSHTPSSLQHHHHKGLCKPHYATLNFWSLVQSTNLLRSTAIS